MLSISTLNSTATILAEDPFLWSEKMTFLGHLDQSEDGVIRQNKVLGENPDKEDFLRRALYAWVENSSSSATISKIVEVLLQMGCKMSAGRIRRLGAANDSSDDVFVELAEQIRQLDADTLDSADKSIPLVSVSSLPIPQRVIRALGAGAFGIVFEIEKDGTHLAQKILIETANSLDEREFATILRECEPFVGKEHVNIVKVLDYQFARDILNPIENLMEVYRRKTENQKSLEQIDILNKLDTFIERINRRSCTYFSINMELCGSTLRQWFNANENATSRSFPSFRLQIGQGIISGLKYLHGENIIHRDLKPENIYFAKDPFQLPVKIGDFGNCRQLHDIRWDRHRRSRVTSYWCTPPYTAPETERGEKYTFPADLYSLGMILFEVFQIIKSDELRRQLLKLKYGENDVIIDNPNFPNLKESIINLTRYDIKDRVQSIDDVIIINVNDKISE